MAFNFKKIFECIAIFIVASIIFIFVGSTIWQFYQDNFGKVSNVENNYLHYNSCGGDAPVNIPFPVHISGTEITCDFVIKEHEVYIVIFRYLYKSHDINVTKEIYRIANRSKENSTYSEGGPMIVAYTLKSLDDGIEIKKGVSEYPSIYSSAVGEAFAKIAAADLMPGKYQIHIKNIKNAPEMAHIQTEIAVQMQGGK